MAILFAALSALSYGAADFLGGVATRRNRVYAVLFWSQLTGLVVAVSAAPLVGADAVPVADLIWGAASGLGGAVGIMLLYRALAETVAAVASPVAAVVGAVFPVIVGLALGERPGPVGWVGVALAIPAILLLSRETGERRGAVGEALRLGVFSGLGFGAFFVCLSRTGAESGLWPLVAARVASIVAVGAVTLLTHRTLRIGRGGRTAVAGAGLLDMLANVFYLVAARTGLLILVTVVTSLYPAPTVVLARVVYREPLGPARVAGILLSIAGVAMIGVG